MAAHPPPWSTIDARSLLTPALVVDAAAVEHNVADAVARYGGPSRWMPHVKTAKLGSNLEHAHRAGVRALKVATPAELEVALAAGAEEVLWSMPLQRPHLELLGAIAAAHPGVRLSALLDDPAPLAAWPSGVGAYLDLNVGMNRTGVPVADRARLIALAAAARSAGVTVHGLHAYDGHLGGLAVAPRRAAVAAQALELVAAQQALGALVGPELVCGGTASAPLLAELLDGRDNVRFGAGTVVLHDLTSLQQVGALGAGVQAAVVLSRVISRPAADLVVCDAGQKAVSHDYGIPHCRILDHPHLRAERPSDEHLPLRVVGPGPVPAMGEVLVVLPTHVCTTMHNFDEALVRQPDGGLTPERMLARGRGPVAVGAALEPVA
jgi:D-serine deaminase-like pyridoxal phosphate-dependent protein